MDYFMSWYSGSNPLN